MTKKKFKSILKGVILGAIIPTFILFIIFISTNFIFKENFFMLTTGELLRSFVVIAIIGGILGGIGEYIMENI